MSISSFASSIAFATASKYDAPSTNLQVPKTYMNTIPRYQSKISQKFSWYFWKAWRIENLHHPPLPLTWCHIRGITTYRFSTMLTSINDTFLPFWVAAITNRGKGSIRLFVHPLGTGSGHHTDNGPHPFANKHMTCHWYHIEIQNMLFTVFSHVNYTVITHALKPGSH